MTMGIVDGCFLGSTGRWRTARDDDVHLETHQLGRKRGKAIWFSLCVSLLDDNIFSLHVAKLAQTLSECLDARVMSATCCA